MTDGATPRPWRVHENGGDATWLTILQGAWDISHNDAENPGVVASARYSGMSPAENRANAELIVRAVNSHDQLVEALKAVQRLDYFREHNGLADIVAAALAAAEADG